MSNNALWSARFKVTGRSWTDVKSFTFSSADLVDTKKAKKRACATAVAQAPRRFKSWEPVKITLLSIECVG